MLNSQYGDGPKLLELKEWATVLILWILWIGSNNCRKLQIGRGRISEWKGPVNVKVIDPLNVVGGDFELK